jgi:uncharacterized protein DUF3786
MPTVDRNSTERNGRFVPPPQRPYDQALALGAETIKLVSDDCLTALGACTCEENIEIDVLGTPVRVARKSGRVLLADNDAPTSLAICVLHHLAATPRHAEPSDQRPVSFIDIPDVRGYYPPYSGRVLGRITRRFGPTANGLAAAAQAIGGSAEPIGDQGYRFGFFPRVPVWLTYFLGDDEFPPAAALLYRPDITSYLPAEDLIVMSELLAARLCGKSWSQITH